MAKSDLREWAVKGAEQLLVELGGRGASYLCGVPRLARARARV